MCSGPGFHSWNHQESDSEGSEGNDRPVCGSAVRWQRGGYQDQVPDVQSAI